jgi:hypothetical protein
MRVHLDQPHNFASRWRRKTQFSVVFASPFFVMPDLIRHPAFAAVISGTPDQVRSDEEMMARLL